MAIINGIPVIEFVRSQFVKQMGPPQGEGGPGGPGGPDGPGGPGGPDGGPGGPEGFMEMLPTSAAIVVKNGEYKKDESSSELLLAGEVSGEKASGVRITAEGGTLGGVYVAGAGTDYVLENAIIKLSGDGQGLGGMISGAAVEDNAVLTLKNVDITTDGRLRCATSAGGNSVLKVYDSVLVSHGAPWRVDEKEVTWVIGPGMSKPPVFLEIEGNCRTHCTVQDSASYFYNSTIIADSWAALSTDAAGENVYLEANDCKVITTRSGYGTYADTLCHCVLNRCDLVVANMAAIIAGESDAAFNDTKAKCGTYFALIHCVGGSNTQVSGLKIKGGDIRCGSPAVIVKSDNADIEIDGAKVVSDAGILIKSRVNDDPCAAKVGNDKVYGIHVVLKNMDTENSISHEDTERIMSVKLINTTLKGAITGGAYISLDGTSKWLATADSDVILMGSVDGEQIDAPAGVTITAAGGAAGAYALESGGKLIVK